MNPYPYQEALLAVLALESKGFAMEADRKIIQKQLTVAEQVQAGCNRISVPKFKHRLRKRGRK